MMHPLAARYLERLRRAGRRLPPGQLQELLDDIEGHLAEAIEPAMSDAEVLTVLDRLGEPDAIVAAEASEPDDHPAPRTAREWVAILLLLLGGFLVGIGWVGGLVLLWSSRAWKTREKWLGTLVVPGGLATSVVIGLIAIGAPSRQICRTRTTGVRNASITALQHCVPAAGHSPSILGIAAFAVLVIAPTAVAIRLARVAGR